MGSNVSKLTAKHRQEVVKILRAAKTFYDDTMREAFEPEHSDHPMRNLLRDGLEDALVFRTKLAMAEALEIREEFAGPAASPIDDEDEGDAD